MNRAVFFDRDGVLNEIVKSNGGCYSPRTYDQFKLRSESAEVIKLVKSHNYLCIVVSNQPDITRGLLRRSELDKMTDTMNELLQLDDVFYCIHDDYNDEGCRKPAPGLLIKAKDKWDIDLCESIMIGDTWKDVEAARNTPVKMVLFETDYNSHLEVEHKISDLFQIEKYLI